MQRTILVELSIGQIDKGRGLHGDCSPTGEPILFGMNSYSGCKLKLPEDAKTSCLSLNQVVLRSLCSLLPSTYVSKGGNPQIADLGDFIPIIREDYCFGPKDPLIPEDAEMDLCTSVPTHLEITIFHSVAGEINGFVFHQITGMRIRSVNTTWPRCRSPNNDENSSGCWDPESSNISLSIFITSSVDFVEIPSNLNPSTKKFWLIQNSAPCYGDSCWSEIAFPFVVAHQGDTISYVTKWGLVLAIFGVIILCLTKPFW